MLAPQAYAIQPDGSGQREAASPKKQALARVAADRKGVIRDVVRRGFLPAAGPLSDADELRRSLSTLSDGELADALLADGMTELTRAVHGSPVTGSQALSGPAFLGNATRDLVYTPLAVPCRLWDTRKDNRGPMSRNESRVFAVQGTFISNQGGDSADCSEVPFDPPAVVITLTSVATQGRGSMRLWAYGNTTPKVDHLNFKKGLKQSNTTATAVCQNCGSQNDVIVQVKRKKAQVIGDIVGYFERPQGCAPGTTEIAGQCFQTSLRSAANLFTATADCEDEGGRLPTAAETFLAVNTLTGAAGGEHTGTVYNADIDNGSNGFRNLRITSTGTLIIEFTLNIDPYRCVFDPFEFN